MILENQRVVVKRLSEVDKTLQQGLQGATGPPFTDGPSDRVRHVAIHSNPTTARGTRKPIWP